MKSIIIALVLILAVICFARTAAAASASDEAKQINDILSSIEAKLAAENSAAATATSTAQTNLKTAQDQLTQLIADQKKALDAKNSQVTVLNGALDTATKDQQSTNTRIQNELIMIQKIRLLINNVNGVIYGSSSSNPGKTCQDIWESQQVTGVRQSGVFYVTGSFGTPTQVFCNMTDNGGFTMVWSNVRAQTGKPTTGMKWAQAINTNPIVTGNILNAVDTWSVYTGLSLWKGVAPNGILRYDWAPLGTVATYSAECNFAFSGSEYTLSLTNCKQILGNRLPGIYTYHNNRPFSAVDHTNSGGCASYYSSTPFWYGSCWSGSINGGGEISGNGYFNGAYWDGSQQAWATPTSNGNGAGVGWISVR